jgi:hypothetical protein
MKLEIKIAEALEEKRECFRIRYLAYEDIGYVTEEDYPTREITDKFDEYSIIFIALKDGRGAGTIRVTRDSEYGFQMEELFDLTELRKNCKNLWESSKIMALPGRKNKVTLGLANIVYLFMKKNKINDLCYMAHPDHARMYEKIGIYPFAETKIHPEIGQPAVPLHWDLKNTKEPYLSVFNKEENTKLFNKEGRMII